MEVALFSVSQNLVSINWNNSGTIIDLGFYQLRWYSLLFGLGFIFSFEVLKKYFKKDNVPFEKLETLLIYMVLATIIGARLGHCLFYEFEYYSQNIAEIFLPFRFSPKFEITGYQGLASHGGVLAIFISTLVYAKRENLNAFWVLDKLALVGPLAGGFIRLGNFMNSEMIGVPSSLPWAIVFQKVDSIPRHPGQLYEALAYFLIFIFLNLKVKNSHSENGYIFGLFLVLLFGARFGIEFFKIDQVSFESGMWFNMGQVLSIPFIILGIILTLVKNNSTNRKNVGS